MAGEFVEAPAPTFVDAPAPTKAKASPQPAKVSSPYATGAFVNPGNKPAINTAPLDAALGNQTQAAQNTVTGTLGLLQRPADAWDALLTGGNAWNALTGSSTPQEQASTQAKVNGAIDKFPGGTNPIAHGIYHAGMNPLNLVDLPLGAAAKGRSVGQLATDALEGHGFNAAVKAGGAIAKTGPVGQKVTDTIAGLHDFSGVHSAAKRELANLNGPAWLDAYSKYRARLMQMGDTAPADTLKDTIDHHLATMPFPEVDTFVNSLNRASQGLPFASPLKRPSTLAPTTATGDPVAQSLFAKSPAAPPSAKPVPSENFTQPGGGPNGQFLPSQWEMLQAQRANEATQRSQSALDFMRSNPNVGAADAEAPSLFARNETVAPTQPKPLMRPDADNLAQTVQNVASDPRFSGITDQDKSIFDLMKKNPSLGIENPIWKALSAPSDLMTAGIFAVPFGHMANISTLGALTDPTAVAGALGRGTVNNVKSLFGKGETEEALAARHAPAQAGGAISSHAFERDNPLVGGLDTGSNALDSLAAGIKAKTPGPDVLGNIAAAPVQAISMIPKALSGLYKASGNVLWKFDDEVKAQRFQNLVDSGMDPQRAGLRVGGELVDYENKSPVAGAIRPIAPFATWRTKAPLAVGRNILENPGKASAIQNQLPAVFGGDQGSDPDTGQPYTSSLPAAELGTLLDNPAKYLQGSVGAGPRLAGDAAGALFSANKRTGSARGDDDAKKKFRTLFTYGKEPLDFALNHVPALQQYLQYTGNDMFGSGTPPSLQNDILSQLLVRPH